MSEQYDENQAIEAETAVEEPAVEQTLEEQPAEEQALAQEQPTATEEPDEAAARPTVVPWDSARAQTRDGSRLVIETLDLHCAGEPLRLIRSGYPAVPLLPE